MHTPALMGGDSAKHPIVQNQPHLILTTRQLAGTAVLSAIAAVLEFLPIDLPFPLFPRLTLDPVGIPIAIAAILYGPSAGFMTAGIAGIVITARGNPIGASFKFAAEVATVVPLGAALYFSRKGFAKGGIALWLAVFVSWTLAIACRVAAMTGYNYYFLQVFYGIPEPAVAGLLPVIAAFNGIQGLINVIPAYLIVDRLPPDLKPEWLTKPG